MVNKGRHEKVNSSHYCKYMHFDGNAYSTQEMNSSVNSLVVNKLGSDSRLRALVGTSRETITHQRTLFIGAQFLSETSENSQQGHLFTLARQVFVKCLLYTSAKLV